MARRARATPNQSEEQPPKLDAARFAPTNRRHVSGPGLRAFIAISDLWGLTEEQRRLALGLPSRSTFHNWIKAVREHREITLDVDTLTRISLVLGIHQALGVLYDSERDAVAWLRTPHATPVFGGRPPIDLIASGTQDGLFSVRRFLDAARGGLYMPPNELDRVFSPYTDADIVFS
ncbi:MAG: MbcA/ParS/Xre antitoxin family protein [Caulobacteraceae bacterium]